MNKALCPLAWCCLLSILAVYMAVGAAGVWFFAPPADNADVCLNILVSFDVGVIVSSLCLEALPKLECAW